jgi:hypothetical protein
MGRFVGRVSVLGVVVLVAGLLSVVVSAGPAVAVPPVDPGCQLLGGSETVSLPVTCEVSAAVSVSGVVTVGEPLHLLAGAHLDATASVSGLSLTVTTGDLVMDKGAVIEGDDDASQVDPTGGRPITIDVQNGSLTMVAGSRISSDNNAASGSGGDITITVPKGDVTMFGTPGTDQCRSFDGAQDFYEYGLFKEPNVFQDPTLGAVISSHRWGRTIRMRVVTSRSLQGTTGSTVGHVHDGTLLAGRREQQGFGG